MLAEGNQEAFSRMMRNAWLSEHKSVPPIFGPRLIQAMERRGISRDQLSKQLHISEPVIAGWRTGRAVPRVSMLIVLADTLGVSVDWLLGREAWYVA